MEAKQINPGLQIALNHCVLKELCAHEGVSPQVAKKIDLYIRHHKPMRKNQALIRPGDRVESIYCIRSGSFKTYYSNGHGQQHIIGFHLPGETVGMGALFSKFNVTEVVALETSSVCEIRYRDFMDLAKCNLNIMERLNRVMIGKVAQYQSLASLLGSQSAEERLAAFICSLSDRFRARGFSPTEFYLSMKRSDIADFLGMATETVSRIMSFYQEVGLLKVERKHVVIEDLEMLRMHAGDRGVNYYSD